IGYDLDSVVAKMMSVSDFVLADGEEIEYDLTLRESEVVNTGFKPRREIRALRDFFLSPEKYAYKKGVLFPISLTSKSIDEFEDGQNLYALSFEIGCKYVEELFGGEDEDEAYSYAPNLQAYVPVPPEVPEVNYDDRYYLKTETYNKAEIDSRLTILQSAFDTLETHVNDELTTVIGLLDGKADRVHEHPQYVTPGVLYDIVAELGIFAGEWVSPITDPDEGEEVEAYLLGQVVIHQNKLWKSQVENNTSEPGTNADWLLVMSGGDTTIVDVAPGTNIYSLIWTEELKNKHGPVPREPTVLVKAGADPPDTWTLLRSTVKYVLDGNGELSQMNVTISNLQAKIIIQ